MKRGKCIKTLFKSIIFIVLVYTMWNMSPQQVRAAEDGDYLYSNLSVNKCQSLSGVSATNVYSYCNFYCNFWNPNQNFHLRSATVKIKNASGNTVYEDTVYSESSSDYFSWAYFTIYLTSKGTYTIERSATTLEGDTISFETRTFTVYDVSKCGTKMTLSSNKVSLNINGTRGQTITVKVSGVKPKNYGVSYSCSNNNVSCVWGEWYTAADGNRAVNLTITGRAAGTAKITVKCYESTTDKTVASKTVSVTIGPKYKITYYANGGTGAPASQIKYYGKTLKLRTKVPTWSNHQFAGWATTKNATTVKYKSGATITVNKNLNLYAVWKKKATITAASKTVAYNKAPFNLNAKSNSGGKLTYSSSNKKVATVSSKGVVTVKGYGKTTITVKVAAKGIYKAASKKITITVKPKKGEITSLKSPGKKEMKIKWRKDSTVTGYHIYVSLNQNFKRNTFERYCGRSITSTEVPLLKSGKTYYVKVRSYKKVNGKTYYGAWSAVKSVKVK